MIACVMGLIALLPLTVARAQPPTSTPTVATDIPPDVTIPILSAAGSTPTPTVCPLLGSVSFNSVDVQPVDPVVGDVVVLTFDVQAFVYSLSGYTLEGAEPLLTGYVTITAPNSPTFELHAVQSGTAIVRLRVDYQAERDCNGVFIPEYTSATSPAYSIAIGETPPSGTTPTPTPTCAATGTPYCSNDCPPAPTIAPGCFSPGGGPCIQNPQCASNEVCVADRSGQIGGCCACGTMTPTVTNPPSTPTPRSAPSCIGDCDDSGGVTVNELIILVNIALGNDPASTCPHGVPSGAEINIALIMQAVDDALNGCGG
jgi:hypothetical protein